MAQEMGCWLVAVCYKMFRTNPANKKNGEHVTASQKYYVQCVTYDETDLNEDAKKHAKGDISFIQNLVPTDNGPMDASSDDGCLQTNTVFGQITFYNRQ